MAALVMALANGSLAHACVQRDMVSKIAVSAHAQAWGVSPALVKVVVIRLMVHVPAWDIHGERRVRKLAPENARRMASATKRQVNANVLACTSGKCVNTRRVQIIATDRVSAI